MKQLIVLLFLVPFSNHAQSLNRILYEKYFKALYTYEPALIRENKIESLEVMETEFQDDSLTYMKLKQKVSFRKDGRPVRMISWTVFHRDSVMFDYSYDSLGNLIEYRQWKTDRYAKNNQLDISHWYFVYENNRLVKAFNYSTKDDNLTQNRCDSLTYKNDKTVKFTYGNGNNSTILFNGAPHFIYPVNKDYSPEFLVTEDEAASKPFDKESCWNSGCSYADQVLKDIQRHTGTACIPNRFVDAVRWEFPDEFDPDPNDNNGVFLMDYDLKKNANAASIDTVQQLIFLKESWHISEPTSMENRNTSSRSVHQFDYFFRILHSDVVVESSRGNHEHVLDSSQVDYTYFSFGLLQQKRETHDRSSIGWKAPVMILEEKTTIKRW